MDTIYIEKIKDGKLYYRIERSSHILAPRLKAREGRIRRNLLGKKADNNMRSVITCDPVINEK
ncbi:DNA-directed RNA polymerase subunit 1 [Moumouvirus goulette]|uniref:DNA-directed RNA polymerase subunit 1 n=1 Tax=Moumouvirus goulette TaxID=1247379 RepID=M1PHZ1_9VIRU|nr:DNA-directed RNA polymerase subunit 1 [Moumouvirus goulette]AGF85718.1 DNA-directed RNA polymerase subunit 1 [Moumouvirus goulette]